MIDLLDESASAFVSILAISIAIGGRHCGSPLAHPFAFVIMAVVFGILFLLLCCYHCIDFLVRS